MTSFAPTPEGRAAAERMMKEFGHTNVGMPPRPGFPGRSPATPQAPVSPQNLGAALGSMQANSPQLAQMQSMLQGAPIGGAVPARSGGFGGGLRRAMDRINAPAPQTAQTGLGSAPPSMASQLGAMGLAGVGLAGIPNPTRPAPTGMSPTQSQAVQAVTNKMQGAKLGAMGMKKGGAVKKKASGKTYKSGGSVSSASKRADGCAIKGKTRCKIV